MCSRRPAVGICVMVAGHHSFGSARRAFHLGVAESAYPAPSAASCNRSRLSMDVAGRLGDRLSRRPPGQAWERVSVRRFCRSNCRRCLLELVCTALGAEPMVALGPANSVRVDFGGHIGRVLRARPRYRLPETNRTPIRVCRCPDLVNAPHTAAGRVVSNSGRGRPTWNLAREIPGICLDRRNLRQSVATAALVGTILFLINQADVVFGGHATTATWIRIGLSYLVPLFVCNYGIVVGSRRIGSS